MTRSEIKKLITLPDNVALLPVQKEKIVEQWRDDVGYRHKPTTKTEVNNLFNMAKEYYQKVFKL